MLIEDRSFPWRVGSPRERRTRGVRVGEAPNPGSQFFSPQQDSYSELLTVFASRRGVRRSGVSLILPMRNLMSSEPVADTVLDALEFDLTVNDEREPAASTLLQFGRDTESLNHINDGMSDVEAIVAGPPDVALAVDEVDERIPRRQDFTRIPRSVGNISLMSMVMIGSWLHCPAFGQTAVGQNWCSQCLCVCVFQDLGCGVFKILGPVRWTHTALRGRAPSPTPLLGSMGTHPFHPPTTAQHTQEKQEQLISRKHKQLTPKKTKFLHTTKTLTLAKVGFDPPYTQHPAPYRS